MSQKQNKIAAKKASNAMADIVAEIHAQYTKIALDHLVAGYAVGIGFNLKDLTPDEYLVFTKKVQEEVKLYNSKFNKEAENGTSKQTN